MTIYFQKVRGLGINLLFLLLSFFLTAQVGINNSDPKTALDVKGALSLQEGIEIELADVITDNNINNLNLGEEPHSLYRFKKLSQNRFDFNLTGIIPVAGSDGQMLFLVNGQPGNMTIIHDSGSDPKNRIYVPGEKDIRLSGKFATVTLLYSKGIERWVVLNNFNNQTEVYSQNYTIKSGSHLYEFDFPNDSPRLSASVSFVGRLPSLEPLPESDLFIEYVETSSEKVFFRILNSGSQISNVDIAIYIHKIWN